MQLNGPAEFLEIIRKFSAADIDFVVIGGLAVAIQGGNHTTYDVDFAYHRRRENAKKIAAVLSPLHPLPADWPEGVPFIWDDQTLLNSTILTLDTDLARVDLLGEAEGAPPYDLLKQRATELELDGRVIYVASIDDLIAMKRAAGRQKDLGHIAELEVLKQLQEES